MQGCDVDSNFGYSQLRSSFRSRLISFKIKKHKRDIGYFFSALLLLSACATPRGENEAGGMIIGGKNEQIYGTACRQADGSWKVKN
jgi:hypothetical protein